MSIRTSAEWVIYGSSAILIMKALDLSPVAKLFNGRYYIPLIIGIGMAIYARKIAEKIGGNT